MTLVLLARQDLREMMEIGVMMEKSGPEGCPGNPGRVVCWGQRDPRALLDLRV